MLCRVDSVALSPTEVPVLPQLHSQLYRSFPVWIWQPYPRTARGDLATKEITKATKKSVGQGLCLCTLLFQSLVGNCTVGKQNCEPAIKD